MSLSRWLWVVVLVSSFAGASAEASARVAVLDFKGGAAAKKARAALMKSLCKAQTCVKPGKGGEEVEVDGVVVGAVKKVKGKQRLELAIYSSEDEAPVTKTFALKAGKLEKKALKGALKAVGEAVAGRGAASSGELAIEPLVGADSAG